MTNEYIVDTPHESTLKTPWFMPSDANIPSISARTTLAHLPLANPRAYHRSKLITATTGINPLLTAATALFAYIDKLRTQTHCDDTAELYVELQHEIKAFEAQAQTLGYRSDNILVARYILCALLDETILTTSWGQQSQWYQHKLLFHFHNEDWGGDRFFVILKRLSADPALHIDTLELAYLCLSLGFSGKYQFSDNGYVELEKITDHLYQCIRWQRGDIKKELAITAEKKPATATIPLSILTQQTLSPVLLCTLTLAVMSSFYFVFNFLLGQAASPLYQQLSSL